MSIAEKTLQLKQDFDDVHSAGVTQGKQSEYDAFWDNFQYNGKKIYYDYTFAESGNGKHCWSYGTTYKPKYVVKPKTAMSMYVCTSLPYEAIAEVDFSQCTDFYATFQHCAMKHLPSIDLRAATRTSNMFSYSSLEIIDELKVAETTPFQSCFGSCSKLTEIRFNGTIGQNGLNVQASTLLSHDSLMSIINALADKSQDTSGTVWKVTLGATNLAKLTDSDKTIATKKGWSLL